MGLSAREFDQLQYDSQLEIISEKGILLSERNLFPNQAIVLYSLYNFFVEAIINITDKNILSLERLTLDEVSEYYCKDIPK
jgi:hypothetical protein